MAGFLIRQRFLLKKRMMFVIRLFQAILFFVGFCNIAVSESAIDSSTAAVILEPIKGEGGVQVPPDDYLLRVSHLCKLHGAYLIIDDVQTGFCRTGKLFAIEHSAKNIEADFIAKGKGKGKGNGKGRGLAGGFPIAAFAISKALSVSIEKGGHSGTYCGDPLGCAVVAAVVSHLTENKLSEKVARKGQIVGASLCGLAEKYPDLIKEVRG